MSGGDDQGGVSGPAGGAADARAGGAAIEIDRLLPRSVPRAADASAHVVPARYLTADLEPIGGRLKERPEDFLVEEQPLYEPCGQGEHIYLFLQKRLLSTLELVRIVGKHFRVRASAVGYAGLKDKHAITRQVISVQTPGKTPEDFPSLKHPKIETLWADLHTNKLRRGHLKGNRFSIRVRGVGASRVIIAHKVLKRLAASGVPNRAGEQRFGHAGNNHLVGRAMVLGHYGDAVREIVLPDADGKPEHATVRGLIAAGKFEEAADLLPAGADTERRCLYLLWRGQSAEQILLTMDHTRRTFFLSSLQSAVFNAVLDTRLRDGTLDKLLPGDVAMKHVNGALFLVDEALAADAETQRRLAGFEISPTGPMLGPGMLEPAPGSYAAKIEAEAAAALGVSSAVIGEFLQRVRQAPIGQRRALRVALTFPDCEGGADEHGTYVRCAFDLPAGAFATSVMQEVMKAGGEEAALPPDEAEGDAAADGVTAGEGE